MKKSTIAVSLALVLGSTAVSATAMDAGANFTMHSPGGGTPGSFNDVTGDIGGGTWAVASTSPFFGFIWTAHDGVTFGPGSYDIDTTNGAGAIGASGTVATCDGTNAACYEGIVVGAGQVGGYILFDWNTTTDIDVFNVWDVTTVGDTTTYTSTDVTASLPTGQPNGIDGLKMIDGAFPGFEANFNFSTTVPVPAAAWLFGSGLLGLVGVARRKKAA